MQDQVNKLQKQVEELQRKIVELERGRGEIKLNLDDIQVERVLDTITTGTSSSNTIIKTITVPPGGGTFNVLDFPERLMIYTWKGQRLVIPVYDADKIIYP